MEAFAKRDHLLKKGADLQSSQSSQSSQSVNQLTVKDNPFLTNKPDRPDNLLTHSIDTESYCRSLSLTFFIIDSLYHCPFFLM
jgi:hypothetical protein